MLAILRSWLAYGVPDVAERAVVGATHGPQVPPVWEEQGLRQIGDVSSLAAEGTSTHSNRMGWLVAVDCGSARPLPDGANQYA